MTTTNDAEMPRAVRVEPRLVTRVAAAHALGIGITKFKELVAAGEIEHVEIGRRILIPVSAVDAYVEQLRAVQSGNGNGHAAAKRARKAPRTRTAASRARRSRKTSDA